MRLFFLPRPRYATAPIATGISTQQATGITTTKNSIVPRYPQTGFLLLDLGLATATNLIICWLFRFYRAFVQMELDVGLIKSAHKPAVRGSHQDAVHIASVEPLEDRLYGSRQGFRLRWQGFLSHPGWRHIQRQRVSLLGRSRLLLVAVIPDARKGHAEMPLADLNLADL